jgi:hypothetical protein
MKGESAMKRLLALATVLSMLLIGMPAVAASTTHHVSPGDDVQAVINAASPGDAVVFALGIYSLSSTLNVPKSLTLTSEDPYAATKPALDGGGTLDSIITIAADDVTIDGLEVANGTGDLIFQGGSYSGTTVRNSVIHDSTGDECVQLKSCSDCLIECSLAYNCAGDGLNIADGSSHSVIRNNEVHHSNSPDGAIYVYYSAAMTVECNYLHDNTASNGIKVYKMGNWGTSYVRNNLIVNNTFNGKKYNQDGNAIQLYVPFDEVNVDAELYVQHNTVDGNTGNASYTITAGHGIYWGQKYVDGAPIYMLDNILSNNGGWGIKTELLGTVNPSGQIDYNDTWNNTLGTISNAFSGVTAGPNNVAADPLYNPDHTLGSGSPCIGTASDGTDMGRLFDECGCEPPVIEVTIDVKPGSFPNSINPKSKGKIPVAVLSSPDFDATSDVDQDSLTFGRTGDEDSLAFCSSSPEDVNDDGLYDLVCHFYTQHTGFECGDTEGILKGQSVDGVPIEGSDSVKIVPCK